MITKEIVAEILAKHLKTSIKVGRNKHGVTFSYAHTRKKIVFANYGEIGLRVTLPPYLLSMIAAFYAEKEVKL